MEVEITQSHCTKVAVVVWGTFSRDRLVVHFHKHLLVGRYRLKNTK